jgi:ketosteroid isomerase-like protein
MSEENVEIVRKAFDNANAFMRGELSSDALAELADPHIEYHWHDERTMPDQPQQLRGFPEFVGHGEQYRSAWVEVALEPLEFIEAPGDRVLVCIRQSGRGRESGVPIEIHFFHLYAIRDGRISKIDLFRHRTDALEAAGLQE